MNQEYVQSLFGLQDQIAVITGGGGILCGAMSKGLAKAGAKVMILDLLEAAAQKVAEEIRREGGQAFAFQADALDKKSLEKVCEEVVKKFGRVDILINGAGGNKPQATTSPDLSFFDLPQDAFRWVFDLNFTCTLLASQVFGKVMAKQKDGIILNVSSMNYFRPLTRVPAYSAAKAAVSNFTQWLAVHFSQNYSPKIRVNAIAPRFLPDRAKPVPPYRKGDRQPDYPGKIHHRPYPDEPLRGSGRPGRSSPLAPFPGFPIRPWRRNRNRRGLLGLQRGLTTFTAGIAENAETK